MEVWLWNIPHELIDLIFQISVADVALMHYVTDMPVLNAQMGALIENYPSVKKHADYIKALPNIAKWIANRPHTAL